MNGIDKMIRKLLPHNINTSLPKMNLSMADSKFRKRYFFTSVWTTEHIATGCCGYQVLTWVQKEITPVHERKSLKGY